MRMSNGAAVEAASDMEVTDVRRWTDEEFYALFDVDRPKHKVIVYNREGFESHVKDGLKDNEVYIEVYSGPMGYPVLDTDTYPEGEQVLRLNFEDLPAAMYWPDCDGRFDNPTITYEDAERAVRFINRVTKEGKDIVVHCDAGVSRSQQVAEYILLTNWWDYVYDEEMSSHPHRLPNTIVLTRLLMVYHRVYPHFNNIDNAFSYNKRKDAWFHKDYKGKARK